MAVTQLETVAKLSVLKVARAPNQARTLSAFHAVKKDSAAQLPLKTEVSFTDDELGLIFVGNIVDVKRAYRDGEGVNYECADAYRIIPTTACTVAANGSRTSKIAIEDGASLAAAVAKVTACVASSFPGGVNVPVSATLAGMDKGGQSVDTWLDDLLRQTSGAIAWVDPNAGEQRLRVTDFYGATDVWLTEGSYEVRNPLTGELLLVSGDNGETINGRVAKMSWEGAGVFRRARDSQLQTSYPPNPVNAADLYKFRCPHKPLKRYIEGGVCKEAFKARIRIGGAGGPEVNIDNPALDKDAGGYFFPLYVCAKDPATGNSLQVDGYFDYTYFDAPLLVSAETDDERLEGEQIEIHDQFFKYVDGANTVDHTSIMQERLDAQFTNQGTIDFSGNVAVHVKGLNVNLTLGSRLMNFTGDVKPRVRSIAYDIVARNMELSVSNLPLREKVDQAKEMKRARTLRGTENWHQNKLTVNPVDVNCFSGWKEADGDPAQTDRIRGGGGSSGGGFPDSWSAPRQKYACVNGVCTQTADGQYGSLEDCQAACKAYYYCLDKDRGVCASALTSGGSMTAEECAANCKPDGTGVTRYVCFRDGCRAVQNAKESDGYATLDDCCQACAGEQNKGPCGGGAKGPQAKGCEQQKPIVIVNVNEAGQVLDVECNDDLEGTVDCSTGHGAIQKLTQSASGKVAISQCVAPVSKSVVGSISCLNNQLQVDMVTIWVWPNPT